MSVVIATYRTDPLALGRLVASLAGQTLPAEEFEVLFVDDGSPDDTFTSLQQLIEPYPNMTAQQIPNSGWACKPRNVGTDAAHGEYVLYMDHDDELFPGALAGAYAFGAPAGADVINPKEVRTSGWSWGWDAFAADVIAREDKHPMHVQPMTPHKLYRRQFLLDHGIAFDEGARVLWEDNYFNMAVYEKADTIAVHASAPFYLWSVRTGSNSSGSFTRDPYEYWTRLTDLFRFYESLDISRGDRDWLLTHYWSQRALGFFGPRIVGRRDKYVQDSLTAVSVLGRGAVPERIDAELAPVKHARAELVRQGRLDLLRLLAEADRDVTVVARARSVRWEGGVLVVEAEGEWKEADGSPLTFRRSGASFRRRLPDPVQAALSDAVLDLPPEDLEQPATVSLKSRSDRSTWPVPTSSQTRLADGGDGTVKVAVSGTGRIDPADGRMGAPLGDDVWDLAMRFSLIGFLVHRGLRSDWPPTVALVDGRLAVAYGNTQGMLSLDLDQVARNAIEDADRSSFRGRFRRRGTSATLTVDLPKVACHRDSTIDGEVRLRRRSGLGPEVITAPAVLVGDAAGVRIEAEIHSAVSGSYDVYARFGHREAVIHQIREGGISRLVSAVWARTPAAMRSRIR